MNTIQKRNCNHKLEGKGQSTMASAPPIRARFHNSGTY